MYTTKKLIHIDESIKILIEFFLNTFPSNAIYTHIIGTVKNNGWYLKASLILPWKKASHARVMPQVGHSISSTFFQTHPTLNIYAQDELTPAKMNSIIDTVNRRLGSKYWCRILSNDFSCNIMSKKIKCCKEGLNWKI